MTYEEMEKSLQELRDAQLVHIRLLDRHEREWNECFARSEERLARSERIVESHENGIAEFRAAMVKLFDRMDRFIQGLERENGHQ